MQGSKWRGTALALLAFASFALCIGVSDAQTYLTKYVYVDDPPEWAPYAGDAVREAIQYWGSKTPAVKFRMVDDPAQSNFMIQWAKEFPGERLGFALGAEFIEVGLGDSDCGGIWSPYSSGYVAEIMAHEIGHVLGHEHSDDPSDIMYPVLLNREYGLVERDIRTVAGYGHFVEFCTTKDISSFDYRVSIDDSAGGLYVYAVTDRSALDKWAEDEPFEFYAGATCFGEDYYSYAGSCDGMSKGSGLLILSPDILAEPLASISVEFEETEMAAGTTVNHGVVRPQRGASAVDGASDGSELFVDPAERYSIRYPASWSVYDLALDEEYDGPTLASFFSDEPYAEISVSAYDIDYASLGDSEILGAIAYDERRACQSAEDACSGFLVREAYTSALDSGLKSYNVEYEWTYREDGQIYETFTRVAEIHSGTTAWYILAETDLEHGEPLYDLLDSVIGSFSLSAPISEEILQDTASEAGTLQVEHGVYDVGRHGYTQAKVYGTVNPQYDGARIALTLTYPDGSTEGKMVPRALPGVFEASFPLSLYSPAGTYKVAASVGGIMIGAVSFDVVGQLPQDGPAEEGGGCLVVTAAYGTELAPQVQRLREIRDGAVYGTESGRVFMEAFNLAYYAFSPAVADWERQSPALRQAVLYALAPMLWSLSVLEHADASSDAQVSAYGAAVLLANAAVYVGMPASSAALLKRRLRPRRLATARRNPS